MAAQLQAFAVSEAKTHEPRLRPKCRGNAGVSGGRGLRDCADVVKEEGGESRQVHRRIKLQRVRLTSEQAAPGNKIRQAKYVEEATLNENPR